MVWLAYLTGNFAYSAELQSFWMAVQGCMAVRNGRNKDKKMSWFHAFMLSVFSGYSGASFTFFLMGKPTSMLSNDLNIASCIIAFIIVNYSPRDIGFKLGNTLPILIVTTAFSQLFRVLGIVKFVDVAFEAFRQNPSEYYPIPVFGPIVFATLLGNMGGFFLNGFDKYLENGMPWAFQNGLLCASFYHFFVNDETGFIGLTLRHVIKSVDFIKMGLDDKIFATVTVSIFMHTMGILQLPNFMGPSCSPFNVTSKFLPDLYNDSMTVKAGTTIQPKKKKSKNKKDKDL